MDKLKLTDSNDHISQYFLIDTFYPSPLECQNLNREIFVTIFNKEIDFYTPTGLFDTTINRYFLTDIKLMEHPLIIKNIIVYCKQNNISTIELLVHNSNNSLANFYSKSFESQNIKTSISFHDSVVFWKNSLTASTGILKKKIKIAASLVVQFCLLLFNKAFGKTPNWQGKPVVLWNSFANNRERIDYPFLDKLDNKGAQNIVHPNPYIFSNKKNWNKSIYRLGAYSISPWLFASTCISMLPFKKKFNQVVQVYKQQLTYMPYDWNIDVLQKTFYFMVYNLLMGGLIENVSKKNNINVTNVFRGGAAAGLIYSGICKKKYGNEKTKNILIPHGTEFNPIDHFSYFFLDYNILPSQNITDNWDSILQEKYAAISKYNSSVNLAGGRIDYAYLQKHVNTETQKKITDNILRIGIVLTYNSDSYQEQYIVGVINALTAALPQQQCSFIVKPRPNLLFAPSDGLKNHPSLVVDKGDVFTFLNTIDIVVGTVSVYGVLTMVVTDAILCNIPALYFFPGKSFELKDLGYSYHHSMEKYCFSNEKQLTAFILKYQTAAQLRQAIFDVNNETKHLLNFEKEPFGYLENFIEYK